jgi:hypothetical protein
MFLSLYSLTVNKKKCLFEGHWHRKARGIYTQDRVTGCEAPPSCSTAHFVTAVFHYFHLLAFICSLFTDLSIFFLSVLPLRYYFFLSLFLYFYSSKISSCLISISLAYSPDFFLFPFPLSRGLFSLASLSRLCSVDGRRMNMKLVYWWTDNSQQRMKYSERRLFQCQSVHQKFRIDYTGIELQPRSKTPASNCHKGTIDSTSSLFVNCLFSYIYLTN